MKSKSGKRHAEFTKLKKLKLKNGQTVFVWGGTQAADGRWAHLRKNLPKGLHVKKASERKVIWKWIRLWQWKSWNTQKHYWTEFSKVLSG